MGDKVRLAGAGLEIATADDGQRDDERDAQNPKAAHLEALARLLDDCIPVPGTNMRFGLDGIVGLVPGVGDAVTTLFGLYLIVRARQLGARRTVIARMTGNVGLDFAVGAIPIVGDLFDFAFKANRRNIKLLRAELTQES